MGGAHLALFAANALSIDKALDVGAIGIVVIDSAQPIGRDLDFNLHFHATGSRNSDNCLCCSQEQVCIVRVDNAVFIEVGQISICQFNFLAGSIVQQGLAVQCVNHTVAIEVHAVHAPNSAHFLAVDDEGALCTDQSGSGVHEEHSASAVGCLDEEVSRQVVQLLCIVHIVNGEGEGILAGAEGIVAQLCLDLAVGIGGSGVLTHQNVGIGHDSSTHIGKACALLQDGVVCICAFQNGNSGGHQQALSQGTSIQTGLGFQIVLTDVLSQKSCHTGYLRSSHRCTAHHFVSYMIINGAFSGCISTANGQNVAAGSGDLRLQLQRTGNTPRGEGAHGVIINRIQECLCAGRNIHGTGPIQDCPGGLVQHRIQLKCLTVCLSDGNDRSSGGVIGKIHTDDAGLVVDNDHSDGTVLNSGLSLLKERGLATVTQSDLVCQNLFTQCSKLLFRADIIQENEFLRAGQGGDGFIGIGCTIVSDERFNVGNILTIHSQIGSNITCIVDRSDGQRVGEGSGRAVGLHAHIIAVQLGESGFRPDGPLISVASRNADHNAAAFQAVKNGLISSLAVAGHTGSTAAQRQVDGVSAQQNGVFNRDHIVGVISTASFAKNLHYHDLCIGSNALHEDLFQCLGEAVLSRNIGIGSGNTGNVRAVLALGVMQVGHVGIDIHIVEAEGNLAADIQVFCGGNSGSNVQLTQNGGDFLCIQQIQVSRILFHGLTSLFSQQTQRILKSLSIKGQMVSVQTGIDDSDSGTGAGVAELIAGQGTDLNAGGSHVGIGSGAADHVRLIHGFDDHFTDTGELLDGGDLAELHIGGNQVGGQGQLPHHIQLFVRCHLDLRDQGQLLGFQLFTVGHGCLIGGQVLYGKTCIDHTGFIHKNGHTHDVMIGILGFILQLHGVLAKQVGGHAVIAYLCYADTGLLSAGGKNPRAHHAQYQEYGKQSLRNIVTSHTSYLFHRIFHPHHSGDTMIVLQIALRLQRIGEFYHVCAKKTSVFSKKSFLYTFGRNFQIFFNIFCSIYTTKGCAEAHPRGYDRSPEIMP